MDRRTIGKQFSNSLAVQSRGRMDGAAMGLTLSLVALAITCLISLNESVGTFIATAFAAILIWRARLDIWLPLLILNVRLTEFHLAPSLVGGFAEETLSAGASFMGIPMSAKIAITFAVPLRVLFELLKRPHAFERRERWLLYCWIMILGVVSYNTYLGSASKLDNWTRPLRFYCLIMSFFYGILLCKNSFGPSDLSNVLQRALLPFTLVLGAFAGLGLFHSHLIYWVLALALALCPWVWHNKRSTGLPIIGWLLAAAVGMVVEGTFTEAFIAALVCLVGLHAATRGARIAFHPIVLGTSLCIIVAVIGLSVYTSAKQGVMQAGVDKADPLPVRLQAKLFGDRAQLWLPAYEQIRLPPHIIVPSGRPLSVQLSTGGGIEWGLGAHNAILETLRTSGLLVGGLILTIAVAAMTRVFTVMRISKDVTVRTLAGAVISVTLVGLLAEDFIFDQNVAFWVWSAAGLAYGFHAAHLRRPVVRHHILRPSTQT